MASESELDAALKIATTNGRVCPMPPQWGRLYEQLPARRRVGHGWEPAPPLILAAWHDTSATLKKARLREHIEWAHRHGALSQVVALLTALPEEQWLHLGE